MDFERFWSNEARRFRPATLAGLQHRFSGVPDVISLAAGLPPSASFPLTALTANTREGQEIRLLGTGAEEQVAAAQQYSFHPQGLPPLVNWLRNLTHTLHRVTVTGVATTQLPPQPSQNGTAFPHTSATITSSPPPPTPPPLSQLEQEHPPPQSSPRTQPHAVVHEAISGEEGPALKPAECGNPPPPGDAADNAPAGATGIDSDAAMETTTEIITELLTEITTNIAAEFTTENHATPRAPSPSTCSILRPNGSDGDSNAVPLRTTSTTVTVAGAATVVQPQEEQQQHRGAAAPVAPVAGWNTSFDVVLTNGATQAICAVIACLTDPGDTLIVDEYTFTHAVECIFLPRQLRLLPVRCDSQGMDPEALDELMRKADEEEGGWDERRDGTSDDVAVPEAAAEPAANGGAIGDSRSCSADGPGPGVGAGTSGPGGAGGGVRSRRRWRGWLRPRLLYTIPTGHNPTGAVMSTERRRRLLEVCAAHDLLILEDDAYCWLSFPNGAVPPDHQPGLGGLPPSLLSLDASGDRVVRVDTFSKLLGPGYRLGWITGPAPLVLKLAMWVMGTTVGPCSVSQVLVLSLLQTWGMDGFAAQLRKLQALYADRAQAAEAAARQHLTGLAEWQPVRAGMFMWIKLLDLPDAGALLDDLVAARVVVVPGSVFAVGAPQDHQGRSHGAHSSSNNTIKCGHHQDSTSNNAGTQTGDGSAAHNRHGGGMQPGSHGGTPPASLPQSPFLRLSFANVEPKVLAEGMRRLAAVVRTARERTAVGELKYGSG